MSAPAPMQTEELFEAELFESDGRQAVRLPEGIHLEGKTVKVRRMGGAILIEPPILDRRPTVKEIGTTLPYLNILGEGDPITRVATPAKPTREELRAFWERLDNYGADPLFADGRDQGTFEVRDAIG